jgi:hypothetical protein
MANFLQKITVISVALGVAVALAAAPKRPFSHKYHLTQVSACENCHTTAEASTQASDNLIPDKSACASCHDEIEIGEPRQTGVQKFNHSKHVPLGSISPLIAGAIKGKTYLGQHPPTAESLAAAKDACTGCHRGIAESENVAHDKPAPSHFPQMADCLVCHNKISPPDSCKQCHVEKTPNFRPTSHAADFGDKHSDKALDKSSCASCHGRKFTCKGCH